MAREKVLTEKRTLYLSRQMATHVKQVSEKRDRECDENVIIREAIRYYLDNQADILGSRRHFQKSFQERIDELEKRFVDTSTQQTHLTVFYLNVIIQLLAMSLAHLITSITKREISYQQLIEKAVIQARKEEYILGEQIKSIREINISA